MAFADMSKIDLVGLDEAALEGPTNWEAKAKELESRLEVVVEALSLISNGLASRDSAAEAREALEKIEKGK